MNGVGNRDLWHAALSWAFVTAGAVSWILVVHRVWGENRLGIPGLAWILNGFLSFFGAITLRVSLRRTGEVARLTAELKGHAERERFLESRNAALQAQVELLSAMREVSRTPAGELSFEPVVTQVFGIVEGLLSAEAIALYFPERDHGLRLAALRSGGRIHFGQVEGTADPEGFAPAVPHAAWAARRLHREGQVLAVPLAAEGVTVGVLAVRLEAGADPEPAERTLRDLSKHVAQAVQSPTLRRAALMDALTGLYTKRHFLEQAPALVARQRMQESPLSLLMADLDHFKWINDTHGHPIGDLALKEVSRRILAAVRDSDTAYRFGGEEIVCLLPGAAAPVAARVANRICREVAATPIPLGEGRPDVPVTISIGVATLTPEMTSWESLLSAADQALYQAKADGRNCVVTFREKKGHA